jgi:hypothetical protein
MYVAVAASTEQYFLYNINGDVNTLILYVERLLELVLSKPALYND